MCFLVEGGEGGGSWMGVLGGGLDGGLRELGWLGVTRNPKPQILRTSGDTSSRGFVELADFGVWGVSLIRKSDDT